jgi:hypothetical protein
MIEQCALGGNMTFQFHNSNFWVSAIGVLSLLVYLAIIAFVIIFIVKSVKYFKRQETTLKEISAKLDKLG